MMKRLRIVSLANSWVVLREEIRLDICLYSDIQWEDTKYTKFFKKYDNCLYMFSTYCDIIKESSSKHQSFKDNKVH